MINLFFPVSSSDKAGGAERRGTAVSRSEDTVWLASLELSGY
jgi:hypothetical protein